MTVVDQVAAPKARPSGMAVLHVGLAVMWAVWAALAWWTSPREASSEQLDADLAAGRIVSYTTADSWEHSRLWAAPMRVRGWQDGTMLVWTTTSGQTFYTTPSSPVRDVEHRLAFSGVLHRSGVGDLAQLASNLALVLVAVAFVLLLARPDPILGTRWFWFWIGQLPLGLGYLAWLWWERPRTAPAPQAIRRSGWLGLGLLLLVGLVWAFFATGARHFFGAWLIPG